MMTTGRRTKRWRERRGGAIVETAFVLPLMLLFLFGIMEYGRYLLVLQMATNAAREACRYAVTHTKPVTLAGVTEGCTTSDVQNVAAKFLSAPLQSQQINVFQSDSQGNSAGSWNGATPGQYVCVQITGSFQITVPSLLSFPSSIPVQGQSVMLCEGN